MNDINKKPIGLAALLLAGFAILGTASIAITNEAVKERIAAEERKALLLGLNQVLPSSKYDNDILSDVIYLTHPSALGSKQPMAIYRARQNQAPVAAVISTIAPDGYSGDIQLILGVYHNGEIAGARVVTHKETPGLGDGIDAKKSDWILSFDGKSLSIPQAKHWKVKKDGGEFDQLTGATITPRAVVNAVFKALTLFQQHQAFLFAAPSDGSFGVTDLVDSDQAHLGQQKSSPNHSGQNNSDQEKWDEQP